MQDFDTQPPVDREVIEAWFEKRVLPLGLRPADSNEELMWEAAIHAAVKPFLTNYARALRGLLDQENWRRGHCPVCGGIPDFSFMEKSGGARWLLCSRCDTEWLFQRLQCPFCSNEDQNTLAYFTDDRGIYRLYVCDRCNRYIKAIDLRSAPPDTTLLIERLWTPDLDREAAEKGYRPGWADEVT
ncbi:MAG: hypothetical protein A2147_09980 [Chloroflexi bacterium RBG_16_57_8]|nr:MAG: hypothetical protein A2147_09980 [Chloroflexi bacterium RBG_16_57_8]